MSINLKDRTRELLRATQRTDRDIAESVGVSMTWVAMFRDGRIKCPSADITQRLYETLTGKSLLEQ